MILPYPVTNMSKIMVSSVFVLWFARLELRRIVQHHSIEMILQQTTGSGRSLMNSTNSKGPSIAP